MKIKIIWRLVKALAIMSSLALLGYFIDLAPSWMFRLCFLFFLTVVISSLQISKKELFKVSSFLASVFLFLIFLPQVRTWLGTQVNDVAQEVGLPPGHPISVFICGAMIFVILPVVTAAVMEFVLLLFVRPKIKMWGLRMGGESMEAAST